MSRLSTNVTTLPQWPQQLSPQGGAPLKTEGATPSGGAAAEVDAEAALQQCDFRISFMEVLALLVEGGCCPAGVERLRWRVPSDVRAEEEHVALVEYLETELPYAEFERMLHLLSERGAQGCEAAATLAAEQRLSLFLDNFVIPEAVGAPRPSSTPTEEVAAEQPPAGAAESEEVEEPTAASSEGDGGGGAVPASPGAAQATGTASPLGQQGPGGGEGEEHSAPGQAPAPAVAARPTPAFWRGFECAEARCGTAPVRDRAPPIWPAAYEEEVANW